MNAPKVAAAAFKLGALFALGAGACAPAAERGIMVTFELATGAPEPSAIALAFRDTTGRDVAAFDVPVTTARHLPSVFVTVGGAGPVDRVVVAAGRRDGITVCSGFGWARVDSSSVGLVHIVLRAGALADLDCDGLPDEADDAINPEDCPERPTAPRDAAAVDVSTAADRAVAGDLGAPDRAVAAPDVRPDASVPLDVLVPDAGPSADQTEATPGPDSAGAPSLDTGGPASSADAGVEAAGVDAAPDAPPESGPEAATVMPDSGSPDSSPPDVPKRHALLVRGQGSGPQEVIVLSRLAALGFAVTEVPGTQVTAANTIGKDVVLISNSVSAGDIRMKLTDGAVPIVVMEHGVFPFMNMTSQADTNMVRSTAIVAAQHPLAAGLSGTVTVSSATGDLNWGIPAGEATVVATLPSQPGRATIFAFEGGARMAGTFVAPARRVGFFAGAGVASSLTTDGIALLDAAILWAAGPQ